MYEKLNRIEFPAGPAASGDYLAPAGSASTTTPALSVIPPANEKWWVYGVGMTWTVAVTANGFNTTAPVFNVQLNTAGAGTHTEKGTLTLALNTSRAIGQVDRFTAVVPFEVDGSAADVLEFCIKTQGAGATTTGSGRPFIWAAVEAALA